MKTARYGWIRDLPDHRDLHFAPRLATTGALPRKLDLRPKCPAVYDQGELGSCTANAIAGAIEFNELRAAEPPISSWTPSRLFIYYNEREVEGTVDSDSGAQIRDGIKVVVREGVCPETEWPYDIARFATKPPTDVYHDALRDRISTYLRMPQSLIQLKACLAEGFPFVFGFSVFESMETDVVKESGVVPLPQPDDSLLGGHAVACVGYDDSSNHFTFRNSWGTDWGEGGYGFLPYAYVLDPGLAADFWTIRSAPGSPAHQGSPSQRAES